MIKLSQKTKDQLWWLIISVDYDYSRISIAEHETDKDFLTLLLEDKNDYKNSLDECLEIKLRTNDFAKVIKAEGLNSYAGQKINPANNSVYNTRVEINTPIKWYLNDASVIEQQWAREAILKKMLTELVENEASFAA